MRYLLSLLLLTGCATMRPPTATSADAQRANVPLATLEQGRSLLVTKCGGCHKPPMPHDHTAREWPGSLDEMGERANLAAAEKKAIEAYLLAMLARPQDVQTARR